MNNRSQQLAALLTFVCSVAASFGAAPIVRAQSVAAPCGMSVRRLPPLTAVVTPPSRAANQSGPAANPSQVDVRAQHADAQGTAADHATVSPAYHAGGDRPDIRLASAVESPSSPAVGLVRRLPPLTTVVPVATRKVVAAANAYSPDRLADFRARVGNATIVPGTSLTRGQEVYVGAAVPGPAAVGEPVDRNLLKAPAAASPPGAFPGGATSPGGR